MCSSFDAPPGIEKRRPADETTARLCRKRFRESPWAALRELEIHFHEGVITVRGVVPTFYTKQVAYATLRQIDGVEGFVDQIEVAGPDPRPSSK